MTDNTKLLEAWKEMDAIYYHEAGHAVVGNLLGFRSLGIEGPLCRHDRRTSSFFRRGPNDSSKSRERASDYAVCLAAGIVAESMALGSDIGTLRTTAGKQDYKTINSILDRLMLRNVFLDSFDVRQSQILLWEAKARAILSQPLMRAALESVVGDLQCGCGVLDAVEIEHAIHRGMDSAKDEPMVFDSSGGFG